MKTDTGAFSTDLKGREEAARVILCWGVEDRPSEGRCPLTVP